MAEPKVITELYAWICTEPDGGHGIPAVLLEGTWMPLVGADRERIEAMRIYAEMAHGQGLPVRLVRFHQLEELEQL